MSAANTVVITDFRKIDKPGAMKAVFCAEFASGIQMHGCTLLLSKNGAFFVSPPSRIMVDKSGVAMLDANGKRKYDPIISFNSPESRRRFNDAVMHALKTQHGEVFQ